MTIHSVCVISNHYHATVSDPDTKIAEFYTWLHKYVSKATNASLGRFENLWASFENQRHRSRGFNLLAKKWVVSFDTESGDPDN